MSANLDLVRSIYTAWARGDYSSAERAHPDIELHLHGGKVTKLILSWDSARALADLGLAG
jgi:ketosteroid isomerase-like protein